MRNTLQGVETPGLKKAEPAEDAAAAVGVRKARAVVLSRGGKNDFRAEGWGVGELQAL